MNILLGLLIFMLFTNFSYATKVPDGIKFPPKWNKFSYEEKDEWLLNKLHNTSKVDLKKNIFLYNQLYKNCMNHYKDIIDEIRECNFYRSCYSGYRDLYRRYGTNSERWYLPNCRGEEPNTIW